jgi:hypothetical protein
MSDVQELANTIVENGIDSDMDFESVDAVALMKAIVKLVKKKYKKNSYEAKKSITIYGSEDSLFFLLKLQEARAKMKGEEFDSLWDYFRFTNNYGVMGGEPWQPRILPNGALLIRNHHRVISLSSSPGYVFKVKNDDLKRELEKAKNHFEPDEKNNCHTFSVLHRTEEGFYWGKNIPDLSSQGETLVFLPEEWLKQICESKVLGEDSILANDGIWEVAKQSRSGHCVFRVFSERTFCHSTFRASDEYDTILEECSDTVEWESEPNSVAICNRYGARREVQDNIKNMSMSLNFDEFNVQMQMLLRHAFYEDYADDLLKSIYDHEPFFGQMYNTPPGYANHLAFGSHLENADSGRMVNIFFGNTPFKSLETFKEDVRASIEKVAAKFRTKSVRAQLVDYSGYRHAGDEEVQELDSKTYQDNVQEVLEMFKKEYESFEPDPEMSDDDNIDVFKHGIDTGVLISLMLEEHIDPSEANDIAIKISDEVSDKEEFCIYVHMSLPYYGFEQSYIGGSADSGNASMFVV